MRSRLAFGKGVLLKLAPDPHEVAGRRQLRHSSLRGFIIKTIGQLKLGAAGGFMQIQNRLWTLLRALDDQRCASAGLAKQCACGCPDQSCRLWRLPPTIQVRRRREGQSVLR